VVPTPYAERVLDLVERIPPGRVLSYGDVAEWLGEGGPRGAGAVLARWGGGVPWHRVVFADGTPPRCQDGEALARLRAEGAAVRPDGRVDMATARWRGDG